MRNIHTASDQLSVQEKRNVEKYVSILSKRIKKDINLMSKIDIVHTLIFLRVVFAQQQAKIFQKLKNSATASGCQTSDGS